jgi:hypothetical protein
MWRRRMIALVLGLLLVAAGVVTYLTTIRGQTMCDLTCMVYSGFEGGKPTVPDGMVYDPETGCLMYPC